MAALVPKSTVYVATADGDTIAGTAVIGAVVYAPAGSSPTATIKAADGTVIWDASSAAARFCDQGLNIRETGTLTINLAGTGTKLYLYTKLRN